MPHSSMERGESEADRLTQELQRLEAERARLTAVLENLKENARKNANLSGAARVDQLDINTREDAIAGLDQEIVKLRQKIEKTA